MSNLLISRPAKSPGRAQRLAVSSIGQDGGEVALWLGGEALGQSVRLSGRSGGFLLLAREILRQVDAQVVFDSADRADFERAFDLLDHLAETAASSL